MCSQFICGHHAVHSKVCGSDVNAMCCGSDVNAMCCGDAVNVVVFCRAATFFRPQVLVNPCNCSHPSLHQSLDLFPQILVLGCALEFALDCVTDSVIHCVLGFAFLRMASHVALRTGLRTGLHMVLRTGLHMALRTALRTGLCEICSCEDLWLCEDLLLCLVLHGWGNIGGAESGPVDAVRARCDFCTRPSILCGVVRHSRQCW